jgi:hypothetical protein
MGGILLFGYKALLSENGVALLHGNNFNNLQVTDSP